MFSWLKKINKVAALTTTPAATPPEVKAAIAMSWVVVASETLDRQSRLSKDDAASTFSRLGLNLTAATWLSAVLVAIFLFYAARRHNWTRVSLLVSTLGGWLVWLFSFQAGAGYVGWRGLGYGCVSALELTALVLLFRGKGGAWYRAAGPKLSFA